MLKRPLILLMTVLAISSCSRSVATSSPTATFEAATALAAFPSLPVVTPTISASPTPFTPFTVKPSVDNLKIRINPGYLFDALMMAQQTDTLTVLGKSPGGEWIYIQGTDKVEGWVFAQLLVSSVDLTKVPVHEPDDVQIIKGRVLDSNGTPIQGLVFNVSQGSPESGQTNVVVSDENGEFFSYLPSASSGTWQISQTGIACQSNVWSDSSCSTYKTSYTGVVDPQLLTVSLPQISPAAFTFK